MCAGNLLRLIVIISQVRGMFNDQGQPVSEATPGTAVEIIGWKELPSAGDQILQVESEVSDLCFSSQVECGVCGDLWQLSVVREFWLTYQVPLWPLAWLSVVSSCWPLTWLCYRLSETFDPIFRFLCLWPFTHSSSEIQEPSTLTLLWD